IRSDNDVLKKRLLREAKAQAQIEHDHVCKIYEVGEVDDKPYIAMQLIQGQTLQELVKEMSIEQKVLAIQQISDAVHVAHRIGIIHRDIKPSNVMIERKEDGSYRPFIMDFGIAREISDPGLTATDVVVGTPSYMAPEQTSGGPAAVDRRTDVYGLGATLYYIFSGKPPFQVSGIEILAKLSSEDPIPLSKLVTTIPKDLDAIISKCLEKEPARRYESARALADDLKRYLEGEPILAKPVSLRQKLFKKIKKNKAIAAILVFASLIILASMIFSIFSYWRASNQVKIARQFSQYVESMDWSMRVAYMSPLHDIRSEKALVSKQLQEIETMMKSAGNAAIGPGNFALGRGHLVLQNYEKALTHLERAWKAGYRDKEVASALGLTLGALFKKKLAEVDRISDQETRKVRLKSIEQEYRDPAVTYLRTGSGSASQSREYGEALLSYYEKKYADALRLTRTAYEKFPWFYEAKMVEGDVFLRQGEQSFQEGNYDLAKKHFENGAKSYAAAEDISRSDPSLYENECSIWELIMEVEVAVGRLGKNEFKKSNDFCRKALIANPDSANAYELLARSAFRWGENQWVVGEDPAAIWKGSIQLSTKAQLLNPESSNAYYLTGTLYGYLADYEILNGTDPTQSLNESIKALLIAVEKDPASAPALTNIGVAYFSQGTLAMESGKESKQFFLKAIDAYEKALKISPRHLAARANIANAYLSLAKKAVSKGEDPTSYFQNSIENYQKAIEINPNHWMIRNNLSTVYGDQISYALDHGQDITSSFQNALKQTQLAEKLKEGNWYAVLNSAEDYVYMADHVLQKNEDPTEWVKKGEERLALILDKVDFVHPFLTLAEAKRIEAEYSVRQKKSPLSLIQEGKKNLNRAYQINAKEHLIPLGYSRLQLIEAKWLIQKRQSPEEVFKSTETELQKALELNPLSAQAYAMLGEVNLRKLDWQNDQKQKYSNEIQAGLDAVSKSVQLKSDLAVSYTVKGKLLMHAARTKSSAKECEAVAHESVVSFEHAFKINSMLKNQENENLEAAKVICAQLNTER
ncbi:MAG TPA: protein kinase, partial [Acidobacteriota bacterium]|nr:protein kinase [Acidobacteriota bacterium]